MSSIAKETGSVFDLSCEPIKLGSIHDSIWHLVDFQPQYQEKSNWCWAAMAVSVALFYDPGTKYTQCEIANGELGRADCGKNLPDDPCNVQGYLMSSLYRIDHFEAWHVHRPEKSSRQQHQVRCKIEAEIKEQIDDSRPLCARITWLGGGAHFVAIYGYAVDPADSKLCGVAIADPWWGLSDLDWDDFPVRYQNGAAYTDSYYTGKS